jgi:hypothetical protein
MLVICVFSVKIDKFKISTKTLQQENGLNPFFKNSILVLELEVITFWANQQRKIDD